METAENPIFKECLWPKPCNTEAPSFREYLLEEFSVEDIIGDPQVLDVLIGKYHDDYIQWLGEVS